jgi:hypothetical protein
MSSESARASSAAEARFRIDAANSGQRAVRVVALDPRSEAVVRRLAAAAWADAGFLTAAAFAATDMRSAQAGWLCDLDGRTEDPVTAWDGADLVTLIATAGEDLRAARVIGEACRMRRATTIAFVLAAPSTAQEALARALAELRPWTLMLTIAEDEDCVAEVLRALRA